MDNDEQLLADHIKYKDPEYSDSEIEGLMHYFGVKAYKDLLLILKVFKNRE